MLVTRTARDAEMMDEDEDGDKPMLRSIFNQSITIIMTIQKSVFPSAVFVSAKLINHHHLAGRYSPPASFDHPSLILQSRSFAEPPSIPLGFICPNIVPLILHHFQLREGHFPNYYNQGHGLLLANKSVNNAHKIF